MSHRHFCHFAGHRWDCNGTALRRDETEPSVCLCGGCHLPLEEGDHSRCKRRVEMVVCRDHREEERRRMEVAKKEYDRRAAEFGFDEKWARMKALPSGPEKHALAGEIVAWLFGDGDKQRW
ncbi:MAG: hypothetical protein ACLQOO_20905 [Terriglobia bacterium]